MLSDSPEKSFSSANCKRIFFNLSNSNNIADPKTKHKINLEWLDGPPKHNFPYKISMFCLIPLRYRENCHNRIHNMKCNLWKISNDFNFNLIHGMVNIPPITFPTTNSIMGIVSLRRERKFRFDQLKYPL